MDVIYGQIQNLHFVLNLFFSTFFSKFQKVKNCTAKKYHVAYQMFDEYYIFSVYRMCETMAIIQIIRVKNHVAIWQMFDTISHFLIALNWFEKTQNEVQYFLIGKYPSPAVTQFDR